MKTTIGQIKKIIKEIQVGRRRGAPRKKYKVYVISSMQDQELVEFSTLDELEEIVDAKFDSVTDAAEFMSELLDEKLKWTPCVFVNPYNEELYGERHLEWAESIKEAEVKYDDLYADI